MHGYDLLYLVNMMISRTTRKLCRVFPAMLVTLATWNYRNEAELTGGRMLVMLLWLLSDYRAC